MKISIITVTNNSEKTLASTIESVLQQTYPDIEYIIVDGDSQDKTVSIIQEYEPAFTGRLRWISEPDRGMYDAMNKGIRMATGDIVGILNSDDFYASPQIIENIATTLENEETDAVYGDVHFVTSQDTNRIVRK